MHSCAHNSTDTHIHIINTNLSLRIKNNTRRSSVKLFFNGRSTNILKHIDSNNLLTPVELNLESNTRELREVNVPRHLLNLHD